jgi:hypothetical protein
MIHQPIEISKQVTLCEKAEYYPRLWTSKCRQWRLIRCEQDIQFILQKFKRPCWRDKSYFINWSSIIKRYGHFETLSDLPSEPFKVGSQEANAFL